MAITETTYTVDDHLNGKLPIVRGIYEHLVATLRTFGPVREEAKKTSIHLARTTAFAGVQTQKQAINLTIRSSTPVASPRIRKTEQVSANRYHLLVKLETVDDVDADLIAWLHAAYHLSA